MEVIHICRPDTYEMSQQKCTVCRVRSAIDAEGEVAG